MFSERQSILPNSENGNEGVGSIPTAPTNPSS